jgi:Tfp pilus assembly PilM family ATPase
MKSRYSKFCGLDLQRDNLCFVVFSNEEDAVTRMIALRIESGDPAGDRWNIWRNDLLTKKNDLKSFSRDAVICGLPSEYAQIKHCLVDGDEKEWREAVEWEMSQQIIGAPGDYSIDYEPAGSGATGTKKYLAVAYRKEIVARTTEMLKSVRLAPRIIDLDLFGLINIFEANYPENRDDISLLVHAERTLTKLVLTTDGTFVDCLSFDHYDEETFGELLKEKIEAFLATVPEIGDGSTENIYLSGSYFLSAARRESVLASIAGSEMLNPFRKVLCRAPIDEHQVSEFSPMFAVAAGLALRGKDAAMRQV